MSAPKISCMLLPRLRWGETYVIYLCEMDNPNVPERSRGKKTLDRKRTLSNIVKTKQGARRAAPLNIRGIL